VLFDIRKSSKILRENRFGFTSCFILFWLVMVAKLLKNYFVKKFGRGKKRPEKDSAQAYRLIRNIKSVALFPLISITNYIFSKIHKQL